MLTTQEKLNIYIKDKTSEFGLDTEMISNLDDTALKRIDKVDRAYNACATSFKIVLLKWDLFDWASDLNNNQVNALEMLINCVKDNGIKSNKNIDFVAINKDNLKLLSGSLEKNRYSSRGNVNSKLSISYKEKGRRFRKSKKQIELGDGINVTVAYHLLLNEIINKEEFFNLMKIFNNCFSDEERFVDDESEKDRNGYNLLSTLSSQEIELIQSNLYSNIRNVDSINRLRYILKSFCSEETKRLFSYLLYKKYICYYQMDDLEKIEFDDTQRKLEIVKELEEIYSYQSVDYIISYLYELGLDLNNMEKFLRNTKNCENPEVQNKLHFLNILSNNRYKAVADILRNSSDYHTLFSYCIRSNKKGFLKLAEENIEKINEMGYKSYLFDENFLKLVNINTLNKANLDSICTKSFKNEKQEKISTLTNIFDTLTFNEFELLLEADTTLVHIYSKLNKKIDDKISCIRELLGAGKIEIKNLDDKALSEFAELINEKRFSIWFKEFSYIKNLVKSDVIDILVNYSFIKQYLTEIKESYEIRFILRNNEKLSQEGMTLKKFVENFRYEDESCKKLFKILDLPFEFEKQNSDRIDDFCKKDLAYVTISYFNQMVEKGKKIQEENILKLVKAELAGKMKDIKYLDLLEELDVEYLDDVIKESWIHDMHMNSSDKISVRDTDSYEVVMQIGEQPGHTCMSYIGGSYAQCLLCNFDGNKKIINTFNKAGRIASRAIIRLTKGSDEFIDKKQKKSLKFVDVVKDNMTDTDTSEESKEELVLFLERPYTADGLSEKEKFMHLKALIEHAKAKAKELNINLVISYNYSEIMGNEKYSSINEEFEQKYYHVYVSFSKNGTQYLDSFDGNTKADEEGKYKSSNLYVTKK